MITSNLGREKTALHVRPADPLRKEDFDKFSNIIDPFIRKIEGLAGFILKTAHIQG